MKNLYVLLQMRLVCTKRNPFNLLLKKFADELIKLVFPIGTILDSEYLLLVLKATLTTCKLSWYWCAFGVIFRISVSKRSFSGLETCNRLWKRQLMAYLNHNDFQSKTKSLQITTTFKKGMLAASNLAD